MINRNTLYGYRYKTFRDTLKQIRVVMNSFIKNNQKLYSKHFKHKVISFDRNLRDYKYYCYYKSSEYLTNDLKYIKSEINDRIEDFDQNNTYKKMWIEVLRLIEKLY